ncbi:MAG: glycosyltransferase family 9 protein [Pseudomonadota bacterium]
MSHKIILAVHHGALGDLILTYPTLFTLNTHSYHVHLLCQDHLGQLTCMHGFSEKSYSLESPLFVSLYTDSVDPAIENLLNAYDGVLLFSYSEALYRTIREKTRLPVFRIPPRPDIDRPIHVAEHLLSRLYSIGLINKPKTTAEKILQDWGKPVKQSPSKRVWIHPGAGSREKMWPVANFIKAASLLRSRNMEPAFFLGPAELFLFNHLAKYAPDIPVYRSMDILELTDLLETGVAFLGNDSGVTHLAAFLGLSTVAVFGPSDPRRWRPLGRAAAVVQGSLRCHPCFETRKRECKTSECFSGISPEAVVRVLSELLPY